MPVLLEKREAGGGRKLARPFDFRSRFLVRYIMFSFGVLCLERKRGRKMPYAVLEKEIERLDETQQNTVVLFVRFLLSQKAAAAKSVSADERPRKYDFSDLIGKVKFDGDPVAYQRSLRDEW